MSTREALIEVMYALSWSRYVLVTIMVKAGCGRVFISGPRILRQPWNGKSRKYCWCDVLPRLPANVGIKVISHCNGLSEGLVAHSPLRLRHVPQTALRGLMHPQ